MIHFSIKPRGAEGFIFGQISFGQDLVMLKSTYQSRNTSTATIFSNHPHSLVYRQGFNDMVDVFRLVLAKNLQCVDLLQKLAIRVGNAWVEGVTLINIDDLDCDDGCGFHVLAISTVSICLRDWSKGADSPHIYATKASLTNELYKPVRWGILSRPRTFLDDTCLHLPRIFNRLGLDSGELR